MQKRTLPKQTLSQNTPSECQPSWLTWAWLSLLLIGLSTAAAFFFSIRFCDRVGTDFRGYYAAAQIAQKAGFSRVYNLEVQFTAQAKLAFTCPDGSNVPPKMYVYVPYLPAYILLFLPLTALDLTSSYYIWSILNLGIMVLYCIRFTRALKLPTRLQNSLMWVICLPVLSNFALGQVNVFSTVCLGEFILAFVNDRDRCAGLWLAALLIKPYILVLLLPGLFVKLRWRILGWFGAGSLVVVGMSLILAGWRGVINSLILASSFASNLIQTGSSMINLRALALNLGQFLPVQIAWGIAIFGIVSISIGVIALWASTQNPNRTNKLMLVIAALTGAFTVSWHAHFYLLMLLVPILAALDIEKQVPGFLKIAWIAGPLLVYLAALPFQAQFARNMLGLSYLALNLYMMLWSIKSISDQNNQFHPASF